MSIFIRPFKVSDLSAFDPVESLSSAEINDAELAQAIEDSGLAVTGIRKGRIIGCVGVHPIDERNGEVWIRLSKECMGFRIETLRLLRDGQKILDETYPFEQLNAAIKPGFRFGIRMAEWLGYIVTEQRTIDGDIIYSKRTSYVSTKELCSTV
jgi:hypothetical protein